MTCILREHGYYLTIMLFMPRNFWVCNRQDYNFVSIDMDDANRLSDAESELVPPGDTSLALFRF